MKFISILTKPALSFSKYYFFVEQGEIEYFILNNRNAKGF